MSESWGNSWGKSWGKSWGWESIPGIREIINISGKLFKIINIFGKLRS